jgi:hypothetical protein
MVHLQVVQARVVHFVVDPQPVALVGHRSAVHLDVLDRDVVTARAGVHADAKQERVQRRICSAVAGGDAIHTVTEGRIRREGALPVDQEIVGLRLDLVVEDRLAIPHRIEPPRAGAVIGDGRLGDRDERGAARRVIDREIPVRAVSNAVRPPASQRGGDAREGIRPVCPVRRARRASPNVANRPGLLGGRARHAA